MDGRAPLKLSVVIVNYRTPDLVIACLESLVSELPALSEVVVVDNASGDDSVELIENWIAHAPQSVLNRIQLVASEINGGFSAGNNLGIMQQRAEYYLLLNSDTIVREHAISTLLTSMEQNPVLGALGPRLEYLDGKPQVSRFRRRGVTSEFIRGAQINGITRLLKTKNTPIELNEPEQPIDWVSFACVLLRGQVVDRIGLMDEGFFMYFEDIEYCLRIKRAGYIVDQELNARVVHLRGGTSTVKRNGEKKQRIPQYFYRSRARYFMLLGGRTKLVLANLAWYLGRTLRFLKRITGKVTGPTIPGEWSDLWLDFSVAHIAGVMPASSSKKQAEK
ncbi:glycosyltransferase family 2 protein [Microbulbifer agarilyticus]